MGKGAALSLFAGSLVSVAVSPCFAQAASNAGGPPQIAGVWRGSSVCAVADSPCHDEVNVYRFSEVDGKPGVFSVTGSKIVGGKEVVMGTAEWKYNAETHTLEADNSGGRFRYVVRGDTMEGTLSLHDNTVYRRVHLVRDAKNSVK